MSTPTVSTYHCICSELLLATPSPLDKLPTRQTDHSHICKISQGENITAESSAILTKSAQVESNLLVLRLEDGFEKRCLIKCGRCGVGFGYRLWSESGVGEDVVFILPNGLVSTTDVESGRKMTEREVELEA
ncbi:hypothetical protein AC579_568 [Pseudocercospora musae]|uniref:STEEP1 domain-containing protein n=1 Tax=Pseudocercospora musae TaxID=113226 RepID=A0A139H4Z5_9PEZI|nr:hypothetical protein AC579_568 [Pseudocercospora musae]